jgi:hypothetical protein
VTAPEGLDDRHELVETIKSLHGGSQRLHQFLPLLRHVAPEEAPEGGIQLEQPLIEKDRRIVGNPGNACKTVLDEGLLGCSQHQVNLLH